MARAAWLVMLWGCAEPPALVLSTVTDAGSWRVETEQAEVDQGFTPIRVFLIPVEDEPAIDALSVSVTATMPSMGHASPWAPLAEDAPGTYEGPVELGMAGIWDLDGEIADGDRVETFTLRISVR